MLAMSLIGSAAAASEKVQFNTMGVSLFRQSQIKAGEDYSTGKGQKIPSVISYESSAGETVHYLPVPLLSDYLNMNICASEKDHSILLGVLTEEPQATTAVYIGGKRPANPTSPELGTTCGPFTEISPSKVNTSSENVTGIDHDNTRVRSVTGFGAGGAFLPANGKHVVLTVKNSGESTATCTARWAKTLYGFERFTTVDIEPGKTLTRAFEIADCSNGLKCELEFSIYSLDDSESNLTVSLKQYK